MAYTFTTVDIYTNKQLTCTNMDRRYDAGGIQYFPIGSFVLEAK